MRKPIMMMRLIKMIRGPLLMVRRRLLRLMMLMTMRLIKMKKKLMIMIIMSEFIRQLLRLMIIIMMIESVMVLKPILMTIAPMNVMQEVWEGVDCKCLGWGFLPILAKNESSLHHNCRLKANGKSWRGKSKFASLWCGYKGRLSWLPCPRGLKLSLKRAVLPGRLFLRRW